MTTIIISPVGEPGSGKSTFSFGLVHALKMQGVRAEFVPEVIKYQSYSPEAMARVVSGRFDSRLLAQQHALTQPLIGRVEVIVNDGALPPFFYYSLQRVSAERMPALRVQLARYMAEQQPAVHRYVTLVRNHAYEANGRRQSEIESQAMRADLLGTLHREFGIVPDVLDTPAAQAAYVARLVAEVQQARLSPALPRARSRRTP
jgi:hypothetical protein